MRKLLFLLLLLPAFAHSQIIYSYQQWADGGSFGSRITLPHDSTSQGSKTPKSDILFIANGIWVLGSDGHYSMLSGGGGSQVQSDYAETDNTQVDFIKNKPSISAVGLSGQWLSILNRPIVVRQDSSAYRYPTWLVALSWSVLSGSPDSTTYGYHTKGYYDGIYGTTAAPTLPAVLAAGRTLSNDDSILLSSNRLHLSGGETWIDNLTSFVFGTINAGRIVSINGTSVVLGSGASDPSKRWTTLFAAGMNLTEDNVGLGGFTLSKPPGTSAPSFLDYYTSDIPAKDGNHKYLVHAWGENDSWYASQYCCTILDYSTARFIAAYHTIIDYDLSQGWVADSIIIVSPVFQGTGRTALIYQDSVFNACQAVAAYYGIKFIDVYHGSMWRYPADKSDEVHPADAGYGWMAATILQSMDTVNVVQHNAAVPVALNVPVEAKQLNLRNVDTATANAFIASINPGGHMGAIPQDAFVKLQGAPHSYTQSGYISIAGGVSAGVDMVSSGGMRWAGGAGVNTANNGSVLGFYEGDGYLTLINPGRACPFK